MDSLGDRIKRYEQVFSQKLTPRSPLFVRVDGKSFHTYTRGFNKPFDNQLIEAMSTAAIKTARNIQGFKLAYTQSDECTFLITDYDTIETDSWFNFEVNKVVSITASMFTFYFNQFMGVDKEAFFDARAFNVPEEDWPNVFVWRQKDWNRNSIQMLARSQYSQKELENKKIPDIHELLFQKDLNWAKLKDVYKNGTFILPDYKESHTRLSYKDLVELVSLREENDNEHLYRTHPL